MLALGVRGAVAVVLVWVCLTGAGRAQALTFPALSGRVVDEAGVLTTDDRLALTDLLAGLEAKTTDQLVVVTLASLRGTTIADYGYQLGRHWQIGQKDKNNGVLLIVVPSEREVRIEVGYGLEGTLTDALTKVIIETEILPRFRAGDLVGGIKIGAARVVEVLTGGGDELKQAAAQQSSADARQAAAVDEPVGPIIVVVVLGVGLLIFCSITGGGLCRVLLQVLLFAAFSGGGRSSRGGSSFSGSGGSFGGGGSSGRW